MGNIITVDTLSGPASFLKGNIEAVQQLGPRQLRVTTHSGNIYELWFNSKDETKDAGYVLVGALNLNSPSFAQAKAHTVKTK
jgi:hypothetical protein